MGYDPEAKMFLADRFVTGTCPLDGCGYDDARGDQCDKCGKLLNAVDLINPVSTVSKSTPVKKTSKHMFIKLNEIEQKLREYLEETLFKDKITSNNTKSIARNWLKKGLDARCITRDLKWGTDVPLEGYESKVFYVWFDAPIGYISITANFTDNWEKWWCDKSLPVENIEFMAKDNVPFHSIVFPCSLIGSGTSWNMVSSLCATEYLNYECGKFSKSRGVGVFGHHAQETGIAADLWRFYLLFIRPEDKDTEFNWNDFQLKINSDLLNNFGNFVNRPLNLLSKFWDGKLPAFSNLNEGDKKFVQNVNTELQSYIENFELCNIKNALRTVLKISSIGNGFLQEHQPWKIRKNDPVTAGRCVSLAVQLVALLVPLMEPFMPTTTADIQNQLGLDSSRKLSLPSIFRPILPAGHKIGVPKPLIKQISNETVELCREKYRGNN